MAGENRVRILATLDDKVSGSLDKIRDRFDTLGKSKGAQSILQGVGVGAGVKAFGLLESAISSATGFVEGSIEAASNLNETMTKSEQIFGKNSDAVEQWANNAAGAFGQSKRAALDVASTFAGLFSTVGLTLDDATDKAKTLTQLGSDLASFFNTDVATATDALRSGLAGESEPLRQFNVFLSETAVAAKATELGMKKVNGQFTEGQKVTARYAIILDQTATAQGDFARTSEGMANQQRTLQAELENTSAKFGDRMIPVVIAAQRAFIQFFDALDGHTTQLGSIGASIGEELASGTTEGLKQTKAALEQGIDKLKNTGLGNLFGDTSEIKALKDQLSVVDAALTRTAAGGQAFQANWGSSAAFVVAATEKVGDAAGNMESKVKVTTEKSADYFGDMVDRIGKDAELAITGAYGPLIDHERLLAAETEVAAQRRILASKTASKEEKIAARSALLSAEQDVATALVAMGKAGQTNSGAYKKGIADLKQQIKDASGPTKVALQGMLDEILAVKRAGKLVPINFLLNVKGNLGVSGARAEGGPVAAKSAYIVGEDGPEVFVPSSSGMIVPNGGSGRPAGGGMGGGSGGNGGGGAAPLTINFNSIWPPTREQAREIARVVDQAHALTLQRAAPTAART